MPFYKMLGERRGMVTGISNPSTREAKTENCHAFEADPGCVVNCRPVKPYCKNFKEKKKKKQTVATLECRGFKE